MDSNQAFQQREMYVSSIHHSVDPIAAGSNAPEDLTLPLLLLSDNFFLIFFPLNIPQTNMHQSHLPMTSHIVTSDGKRIVVIVLAFHFLSSFEVHHKILYFSF